MEIKTIWNILLKIFGLWFALEGLYLLPQLISLYPVIFNNYSETKNILPVIIISTIVIILYAGLVRLFLFRTTSIIDALKLDKEVKEKDITFNFDKAKTISIATIIIGGIAFIDSFPQLIRTVISFYKQNLLIKDYPEIGWIVFYFIKSLLSFLMITNSRIISSYVLKRM